jgi:hypothetical protein
LSVYYLKQLEINIPIRMKYKCVECSAIDKFEWDNENNKTCTNCGLIYGRGNLLYPIEVDEPEPEPSETMDQEEVLDEGKVRQFKGTYERRAHLNERLSAVLLSDPVLPDDVKELVRKYWDRLVRKDYWTQLRFKQNLINKRDIRKLLRFIDEKENPEKKLTIQYLERWKSIREFLTGEKGVTYSVDQVSRVGSVFLRISGIWDFWQPSSWKKERTVWRFKDRKNFPNFNFVFHKIHSLLGPEYKKFNNDFPLPANPTSRKKLEKYWGTIIPQLYKQNLIKTKNKKQLSIKTFLKNGNL